MIRDYSAEEGFEALRGIIETDDGSHRLGEVALGMNNGLERALKHPLFVEKWAARCTSPSEAVSKDVDDPESPEADNGLDEFTRLGTYNASSPARGHRDRFPPGGAGRAVYLDDVQLALRDNIWVVPD